MRTLTHGQASWVYDRIGSWQDAQAFYEDRAVEEMTEQARFGEAQSVFEFGCGTGRYAVGLLSDRLSPTATYHGVDISPTMCDLAQTRLRAHAGRARVERSTGAPLVPPLDEPPDRFVSNYVLDLLSDADIRRVLDAAHAALEPRGLLCLTSLSFAPQWPSRFILGCWSLLRSMHPAVVGGCRPLSLLDYVREPGWQIEHTAVVRQFGVPSQVLVAKRC